MEAVNWRQVLLKTLDDRRLSRAESQAFAELIKPVAGDERTLNRIRSTAFDVAREATEVIEARVVVDWLEAVLRVLHGVTAPPHQIAEAWFSPDPGCPARIVTAIREARQSIDICVFTITDDRLTEAILEAHQRGILIRLITDDEKRLDPGSDVSQMMVAGIVTRTDATPDHMHHKYAIFDERILLTGSYNWTRAAAAANDDNFIVTDDPQLVVPFRAHFERLWRSFDARSA